ncbi:hypothetical protein [Phytohabitans kaempferiae]|uniref:DUF5709 domain-containing protein n=1 Tax=Phytohabitans kaempferiae TaxID=1620943 RepID=A0ABV6M799_9ACTN
MADPDEDFEMETHVAAEERDLEAPAEDTVEQATVADPAEQEPEVRRGLEVNDWDALEQARVVNLDDDYR